MYSKNLLWFQYLPIPKITIQAKSPKGEYGSVTMKNSIKLFDISDLEEPVIKEKPPTFEQLNLSDWLVLYETSLPVKAANVTLRAVPRDRVLVYLDRKLQGTLSRSENIDSIVLDTSKAKKISLLVENQGRINFGNVSVEDFKVTFSLHFSLTLPNNQLFRVYST